MWRSIWLLIPAITACPLPIARTEALSAPLVGRVYRADGTPFRNTTVAVSTSWSDSPCTQTVARTVTDSAGAFRLPAVQKRYRVTWAVPLFDRVAPGYHVCVGVPDTLVAAYRGLGSLGDIAPPDSIDCVEWSWAGRARVTCTGYVEQPVKTAGRWNDGTATGRYRVIVTQDPTVVRNRRRPQLRPHVYLQWLEHTETGTQAVREMVELPIDPSVNALWLPVIWQRSGKWYVSIRGTKNELTFALGPPGQVTRVEKR